MASFDGPSEVTVFFIHGGGFCMNFSEIHFFGMAELIKQLGSCTVVMPEYPLAPKCTPETMFAIVEDVYRQVASMASKQKIVLIGDSAGAGMALVLTQRFAAAKRQGEMVRLPDSLILCSPWLDLSCSNPEIALLESVDPYLTHFRTRKAGEALCGGPNPVALTDPAVSPLYGSLQGLPPVSVWTSTHDILMPDSRRLRDRFSAENIPTVFRYSEQEGLVHIYPFFTMFEEGTQAWREIADAIREDCRLPKPTISSPPSAWGCCPGA